MRPFKERGSAFGSASFRFNFKDGVTASASASGNGTLTYVSRDLTETDDPDFSQPTTDSDGSWHYTALLNEQKVTTTGSFDSSATLTLTLSGVTLDTTFSTDSTIVVDDLSRTDWINWETNFNGEVTYQAIGYNSSTDTVTDTLNGNRKDGFDTTISQTTTPDYGVPNHRHKEQRIAAGCLPKRGDRQ